MRTRHLLLLAHMAPSGVPTVHHLPSGARMGPSSSSATAMPHEQSRARFLSDPRRNSRETSGRVGAESWGWRMPSVTRRWQTALRSGRPSRPGCPRATPGHLSLADTCHWRALSARRAPGVTWPRATSWLRVLRLLNSSSSAISFLSCRSSLYSLRVRAYVCKVIKHGFFRNLLEVAVFYSSLCAEIPSEY